MGPWPKIQQFGHAFLHLALCPSDLQYNRVSLLPAVLPHKPMCACLTNQPPIGILHMRLMCHGLLSPTSMALSIPGKTAGSAVQASRLLAVDNQEEPAIIANYKLQSSKVLFGQGHAARLLFPQLYWVRTPTRPLWNFPMGRRVRLSGI